MSSQAKAQALLMGNQALARGALEAGISVAAGYPGTPSTEIVESLAHEAEARNIHVEWSSNEKVALEVAAAASFAGLRSLAVMKQVGVNVAADFLLHLSASGTRGGLVLVSCEDPGALSSTNEGESRPYARSMEFPLLEPGTVQEAKDMCAWAFDLSESIQNLVMVRSVTRLSHGSAPVRLGELASSPRQAHFHFTGAMNDPRTGPIINLPGIVLIARQRQQANLHKAEAIFNDSPFNVYQGPDHPELLIITSSIPWLYCLEARECLKLSSRVGILKLGTTWPLPERLLAEHLGRSERVLVVEETLPFLEDAIQALTARLGRSVGRTTFFGKKDSLLPTVGELSPEILFETLTRLMDLPRYQPVPSWYREEAEQHASFAPPRTLTLCPGCPHRASFWSITTVLQLENTDGFVCGDIGCYSMAALPTGFSSLKTLHSMGSGLGLACGFGQLRPFGLEQSVVAVCGDSTFFHAVMPALVNAIHNQADCTLIVLDNSGTAMTGFQAHPGLGSNALGHEAPAVDIPAVCRAMGAKVAICDPFDLRDTQETLSDVLENQRGVRVVVLRQICALSPEKKQRPPVKPSVDPERCLGESCGCNRLCTRIFKCPGLIWDPQTRTASIDTVICTGCGVCLSICPAGAIVSSQEQHLEQEP